MGRIADYDFPTKQELAKIPASKQYQRKMRLKALGRRSCPRCDGSGVHVSPNMSGRVCGAVPGAKIYRGAPDSEGSAI